MFKILLEKELKAFLQSPRFVLTFSICAVLMLLSVFIGIQEYKAGMQQYDSAQQLVDEQLRQSRNWTALSTRLYRKPEPMQVFVSGLQYDIGRLSDVDGSEMIRLRNSAYSDDPIFAVFRYIDFSFIVTTVLSLFALLFTYDAVNGERERGTLRLTFANPVPRVTYIMAKLAGNWIGLLLPVLVPILISLLLVQLFNVPMMPDDWGRLLLFLGLSLLFFTFCIAVGVMVSALTRNAGHSFLILLVGWVALVFIVPRAGILAASQIMPLPDVASIDGQIAAWEQTRRAEFFKLLEDRWKERSSGNGQMTPEEREAWTDDNSWKWMQEDDLARREMHEDITAFVERVQEDYRNRKAGQVRLGFNIARFSPVSAYHLAAQALSGSDIDLKERYERAMHAYRKDFLDYKQSKKEAAGDVGGMQVTFNSETGMSVKVDRDKGSLDLSEMPRFSDPEVPTSVVVAGMMPDVLILVIGACLAIAITFVRFLRYDVR